MPGARDEHGLILQVAGQVWGMDASMISQMKALEDENRRLKKMYAEMSMQAERLKEALGKK
jgi:hypothetical protein